MHSAQKSQHSEIQCLDRVQPRRLILAAGLMKAARMDPLIEKVADLDGSEFWPVPCTHSIVREPPSRIVNLYRARAQALFRGKRDFFAGAGDSVMLSWRGIPPGLLLG
jgi:hypothetical protein